MAIYTVQAPDGSTMRIEGPDGASDAEIIAQAQRLWQAEQRPQTERPSFEQREQTRAPNPATDFGASDFENYMAGLGGAVYNAPATLKQAGLKLARFLTPDNSAYAASMDRAIAESQDQEEARRKMDAPLNATKAGMAGNITGNVLQILGPGALLKSAAAATKLPALATASRAFLPQTIQGMATQGAVLGALQPTVEGEATWQNAATGGAIGALVPAAFRTLPMLWRGTTSLLEPFSQTGRQHIVARSLLDAATDPAAINRATQSAIPGVQRNLAEATLDPGLAQFQRAAQSSTPEVASALAESASKSNAARFNSLLGMAGDDFAVESAKQARAAVVGDIYEAASSKLMDVTPKLAGLFERPTMKQALASAERIAADEGVPLFAEGGKLTGRGAQLIKFALDDIADAGPMSSVAKSQQRAANSLRAQFTEQLGEAIPEFRKANALYAEATKPIQQMEVMQEFLRRAASATEDATTGARVLFPDSTARAAANLDKITRNVTGKRVAQDVLAPEQSGLLRDVMQDLSVKKTAENLGRIGGSPTAQLMAGQNVMRQSVGPVLGRGIVESGPFAALSNTVGKGYAVMGLDKRINEVLAEALANPQYAAQIIAKLPPAQQKQAAETFAAAMREFSTLGTKTQVAGLLGIQANQSLRR